MRTLTTEEIQASLRDLPGWTFDDGALQRRYRFARYADGVRFVQAIAAEAEREHHHPDILIRQSDVTLFLSSHDRSGVTSADVTLAEAITAMAPSFTADPQEKEK